MHYALQKSDEKAGFDVEQFNAIAHDGSSLEQRLDAEPRYTLVLILASRGRSMEPT